jgi:hypothetical protein
MALLVGPAFEGDLDADELLDESCLLIPALALLPFDFLATRLDPLHVCGRRKHRQILGHQEIAGKTRGNVDQVADLADVLDGFF